MIFLDKIMHMLPEIIVAFGSSTLFGVADPQYGGYIGWLKKWHEQKNIHNKTYNLGISGQTTTDMLKRFENEVSIRKPQLIIFNAGSNDSRRIGTANSPNQVSLAKFKDNLKKIIRIGKSLANFIFISINPIDDSKTAPLSYWHHNDYYYFLEDSRKYREVEKELCIKEKIRYIDIFNQWLTNKNYTQFLYKDGLHPNSRGHKEIFLSLRDVIEKTYK